MDLALYKIHYYYYYLTQPIQHHDAKGDHQLLPCGWPPWKDVTDLKSKCGDVKSFKAVYSSRNIACIKPCVEQIFAYVFLESKSCQKQETVPPLYGGVTHLISLSWKKTKTTFHRRELKDEVAYSRYKNIVNTVVKTL